MPLLLEACFWFSGAVANNLSTKYALQRTPLPLAICVVGMLVQVCITQLLQGPKALQNPKLIQPLAVAPLSLCTAVAFVGHRLALSFGSVSFTITVKSSNVAITALIAAFGGQKVPLNQWLSVLLVVAGISVAAAAESPFPGACLVAALLSGLAVSLKTVLAKRLLHGASESDRVLVYRNSMVGALVVTAPICAMLEGPEIGRVVPELSLDRVLQVVLSGVCLWWMEYGCFVFLAHVSAVTHGIVNGLCSLCVIVAGNLVLWTWPSSQQLAGVLLTVSGVLVYNAAKPPQQPDLLKSKAA